MRWIWVVCLLMTSLWAQTGPIITPTQPDPNAIEHVKRTAKGVYLDSVPVALGQDMAVARNRVIVHFDQPPSEAVLKQLEKTHDLDKRYALSTASRTFVFHSRSKRTLKLLQDLQQQGVQVKPDRVLHVTSDPNDTYFSMLWGMKATGQQMETVTSTPGIDANVWRAWDAGYTGSSAVVVGMIDTGIDYNHPDLAANVFTSTSGFTVTAFGNTLTCPAGSHGMTISTWPGYPANCDPMDSDYHGTHTAGTVGAIGNNNVGVIGVSPHVTLLPINALPAPGGWGYESDTLEAYAVLTQLKQQGVNIRVTSNSNGEQDPYWAQPDEVTALKAADVLMVAAAGNGAESGPTNGYGCNLDDPSNPCNHVYPALWADLAVASMSTDAKLAAYSNFGQNTVHLAAPGIMVLSTVWHSGVNPSVECIDADKYYCYMGGTSMAAPHVTGVVALIAAAFPNLSAKQIRTAILSSVTPSASLRPIGAALTHGTDYTVASGGYLNALAALQYAANTPSETWVQPTFSITGEVRRPTVESLVGSSPLCSTVTSANGTVLSTVTQTGIANPNFYDVGGEDTVGTSTLVPASHTFNVPTAVQSTVTYSGFQAASTTYSSLKLVVRQRCNLPPYQGDPTIKDLPCAIEYSLDSGATWSTILRAKNEWVMMGRDEVTLPPDQDLTKLRVRYCTTAYELEDSVDHTVIVRAMEGHDIRTEGITGDVRHKVSLRKIQVRGKVASH